MRRREGLGRWSAMRLLLLGAWSALVAAGLMAACSDDDPIERHPDCPNEVPEEGGACPPGLVCSYVEPSGCALYFEAVCGPDGTWSFDSSCQPGGSGGTGGAPGGTGGTAGTGGTGGTGGEAGSGGDSCVDPVPGPPEVTSGLTLVFAPDTSLGTYRLEFSEAIPAVTSHLSWSGAGEMDGVTKVGAQAYLVRFSGLSPGASATLTVEASLEDSCGTPLGTAVDVDISLLASCHYLSEEFAVNFLGAGWSTSDLAGDGNLWARNDQLDPPNGVPNHTNGAGTCASASDVATGAGGDWDALLQSPPIDLSSATNAVLKYQSDFEDNQGNGQAWLEASPDGSSWFELTSWTEDHGPSSEIVDLSAFAGGTVHLRWRYADDAGLGAWWDVDDVCVEEFTKADCPCPPGGFTEDEDIDGLSDGNGTLGTAEPTAATLTGIGSRMSVCGLLEDSSTSGSDWFDFTVNSGSPAGTMQATVRYCIENSFEDATVQVWAKSESLPLATLTTARIEGSFEVELIDGEDHYVSIAATSAPYTPATYSVTVEIESVLGPVLTEGFEIWPPLAFTITDEDPCLDWMQSSQTVVPTGGLPTEGAYLAYFNSYDCNIGSESLETDPLSLAGASTVALSFDMYHDPGYASSYDTIQVQYDDGGGWTDIGPAFERPAAVAGWTTEVVNLNPLAGHPSVRLRLLATTSYGNDIHIDNVVVLSN